MDINRLNYYYNRFKYGEDNFHDLMQNRITDVLLVSTFYDAFILEQDGGLSEQILGEFNQLNLSTYPKITNVPTAEMALSLIKNRDLKELSQFDLIITMPKIGKINYIDFSKKIKEINSKIPVYLLFNSINDIYVVERQLKLLSRKRFEEIDELFLWQGDPKIFLAMLKQREDKLNLEYDTKQGLIRVILLSVSKIKHYSKILPLLYSEIMFQTQRLIDEERNENHKRLRMRARPKIILVHDMREAYDYYLNYKEFVSCLIVELNTNSEGSELEHIFRIREDNSLLPVFSFSEEDEINESLLEQGIDTFDSRSNVFYTNLKSFMNHSIGFGDFIFREENVNYIDKACSLVEFRDKLKIISEDSLRYHSDKNHFSTWLVAHGEIQVAKRIVPVNYSDFPRYDDKLQRQTSFREFIINTFDDVIFKKNYGKIVNFDLNLLKNESHILRLADGSLGGKGRGLAFLGALLTSIEPEKILPEVKICIPSTAIIGTDEFDNFMENNGLYFDFSKFSDREIDNKFLSSSLSDDLIDKLKQYIENVNTPLAVRSSGLLEDSQSQPFAGIYRTYLLPNSHENADIRLSELTEAVKLVFASIFVKNARTYIESINYKIEEEKMAVIIQQVVGNKHSDLFFPDISGVGQSYNYYPTSYIKHSDGLVSLAAGLGKAVVEREKSLSFCPKYPKIDFFEPYEIVENSQRSFYAVNLTKQKSDLIKGEDETLIKLKLNQNNLQDYFMTITSVWDYHNNMFNEGFYTKGPRVITFRMITHYDLFPLPEVLTFFLDFGERAVGAPIELEFAVNLDPQSEENKASIYLLQIRPLMVFNEKERVNLDDIIEKNLLLYSSSALGNGIIENVKDIVILKPDKFDNTKTKIMQQEVEYFNEKMKLLDRKYILAGPGRWGSSDPFLGIPVQWAQISYARVIIELVHKDFNVEASHGSHFFHNVFAMKIGYFTVSFQSDRDMVNWELLLNQSIEEETEHFVHISSKNNFIIKIDGRKGHSAILIK